MPQPDRYTVRRNDCGASPGPRITLCLGRIFADPVGYLAVLIEGPHQDNLRGNNVSFVAALEGLKQPVLGVSKPCRNHVESWKVWVVFKVHNRRVLRNLGQRKSQRVSFLARVYPWSAAQASGHRPFRE